jgi:hypothetical protein
LWEKTRLFNLRLSSDAPNLQVENEETIEALSARTEALLDRIQQRFSFVRSNRVSSTESHLRPCAQRARFSRIFGMCSAFARAARLLLSLILPFPFSSIVLLGVFNTRYDAIGYDPLGRISLGAQSPRASACRHFTKNDLSRLRSRQ